MVGGECAHSSLAIRLATVVRASARCAQLLLQLTESPPFSDNQKDGLMDLNPTTKSTTPPAFIIFQRGLQSHTTAYCCQHLAF